MLEILVSESCIPTFVWQLTSAIFVCCTLSKPCSINSTSQLQPQPTKQALCLSTPQRWVDLTPKMTWLDPKDEMSWPKMSWHRCIRMWLITRFRLRWQVPNKQDNTPMTNTLANHDHAANSKAAAAVATDLSRLHQTNCYNSRKNCKQCLWKGRRCTCIAFCSPTGMTILPPGFSFWIRFCSKETTEHVCGRTCMTKYVIITGGSCSTR